MLQSIRESLESWNQEKNERQKLQHLYLVLTIVVIFFAGIIALFNPDLGHTAAVFGIAALAMYIANGIVWNLAESIILSKLSRKTKRK